MEKTDLGKILEITDLIKRKSNYKISFNYDKKLMENDIYAIYIKASLFKSIKLFYSKEHLFFYTKKSKLNKKETKILTKIEQITKQEIIVKEIGD